MEIEEKKERYAQDIYEAYRHLKRMGEYLVAVDLEASTITSYSTGNVSLV